MNIKIEDRSQTVKIPSSAQRTLRSILDFVPKDHVRGIDRLRLVDFIQDPRVKPEMRQTLPGLYHPKQGTQNAWLEVAVGSLLDNSQPFHKRWMQRLSFKSNLAATVFSLLGQHYYLRLRHSVKKTQLEGLVRAYVQNHLRQWVEREHRLRTRLFKPVQPLLERWARTLQQHSKLARK